jgi:lactate permease
MTVYGSQPATGGIASILTSAKINNAASTIGETAKLEPKIIRKHLLIAIALTVVTSLLTELFITVGL